MDVALAVKVWSGSTEGWSLFENLSWKQQLSSDRLVVLHLWERDCRVENKSLQDHIKKILKSVKAGKRGLGSSGPDIAAILLYLVWSDLCKDKAWQESGIFWSVTRCQPFFQQDIPVDVINIILDIKLSRLNQLFLFTFFPLQNWTQWI